MPYALVGTEKIYYVERGTGLPLIFVHGAASNHLIWGAQLRALGEVARAIALDLPGHNKSSGHGRDSVESYTEFVADFLDALTVDRAVVIGHSMGGAIAQTLALAQPERVAAVGLVATGARLTVAPSLLQGLQRDLDGTAQIIVRNLFAAGADARMVEKAERQFRAVDRKVIYGDFKASNAFDATARIAQIRAPTLVLCGSVDRLTPPQESEFLAVGIPNARLEMIERAGHYAMLEQPQAVNRALKEFVGAIDARTESD